MDNCVFARAKGGDSANPPSRWVWLRGALNLAGNAVNGRSTGQAIELGENQALDTLVALEQRTLKQLGYPREKQLGQISIERGFQRRFVANNVHGCTRFDFFSGAPSAGIQARICAANGNLVASDRGVQHFPLVACISGKITLVVETFGRNGPLLIEQRQEATVNPITANFPRATARLFQRAWNLVLANSLSRFTNLESTLLADEHVWERNITLDPEQCREYLIALDSDATGIDLRIVDIESEEIISGEQHTDAAHAEICAPAGEKPHSYRLQDSTVGQNRCPTIINSRSLAILQRTHITYRRSSSSSFHVLDEGFQRINGYESNRNPRLIYTCRP